MMIIDAGEPAMICRLKSMYPTHVEVLLGQKDVPGHTTCYGYVIDGEAKVDGIVLPKGYAFSALEFVEGDKVVIIERPGYRGQQMFAKVEDIGRVCYIDGCTDSVLIPPGRKGDPCLNSLHFPPGITQSFHTHPTLRAGVVARGKGWATTSQGEKPLKEGDVWLIDAHERHRFRTDEEGMIVVAFHPDSDWGPTDENHPMLNRTYL